MNSKQIAISGVGLSKSGLNALLVRLGGTPDNRRRGRRKKTPAERRAVSSA
jgi:hypothetical protein